MTVLTNLDSTISTQPQWVEEGNIGTRVLPIHTFEVIQPEILNFSQTKQQELK